MIRAEWGDEAGMPASMGSASHLMAKSKPRVGLSLRCLSGRSFACPRTAQTHLQRHVENRGDDSFRDESARCRVSHGHGFQGETGGLVVQPPALMIRPVGTTEGANVKAS